MHEAITSSRDWQTGASLNPRWMAVYTATHHEKSVHRQLPDRNIESFLPVYKKRCIWKKRAATTIDLPLFTNYVFVKITRQQRADVLKTPGVISIVGSGQDAWELPEAEIEALKQGIQLRNVEPHEYLVVGERARVRTGILAGLEGIILRKKSNLQIVLTLDQIMRSVAIEVNSDELEPIKKDPASAYLGPDQYTALRVS